MIALLGTGVLLVIGGVWCLVLWAMRRLREDES